LKLAYYSAQNKDWFFSGSIAAGPSILFFTNVPDPVPPQGESKHAIFVCPRICESLRVNDELRIGLEMSYTYESYAFDPTYVNLQQTYPSSQTKGASTFLGWGFNLIYFIGKPKV